MALTGTGFWTTLPDGGNPNAGFLREGARLLVVAVSDEDDCSEMASARRRSSTPTPRGRTSAPCTRTSSRPVGDYVTAFTRIDDGKGRPREILWGAIAPVARSNKVAQGVQGSLGDGGPVTQNVDCPTSGGPGYRHRAMALAFDPTLTNLDSVCAPDYHQSLVSIAQVASVPQTLTLTDNVPDPRLLAVDITRADASVQRCTLANGGIIPDRGDVDRAPGGEVPAGLSPPADGQPCRGEAALRRLSSASAPSAPRRSPPAAALGRARCWKCVPPRPPLARQWPMHTERTYRVLSGRQSRWGPPRRGQIRQCSSGSGSGSGRCRRRHASCSRCCGPAFRRWTGSSPEVGSRSVRWWSCGASRPRAGPGWPSAPSPKRTGRCGSPPGWMARGRSMRRRCLRWGSGWSSSSSCGLPSRGSWPGARSSCSAAGPSPRWAWT